MDSFIKSKVLNLDSQPSQIWSPLYLNFRQVKLSTQKMPSRFIASKYLVTWSMCKFQRHVLWTVIYGKYLTLSQVSQANFLLPLRKLFHFHQAWFLLTVFTVHAYIWYQVGSSWLLSLLRIFSSLFLLSKDILGSDHWAYQYILGNILS